MNSKGLAKLYDKLTPRERLPLIAAAAVRGDEEERQRLIRSAPTETFRAPHHFTLAEALERTAHYHHLRTLALAAQFWRAWGLWGWDGQRDDAEAEPPKDGAGEDAEFLAYCLARYQAFRFLTQVDAWRQFCAEVKIDPESHFLALPGWEAIAPTEEEARELAFTAEEAAKFRRWQAGEAEGGGPEGAELPPVVSVEGLARTWHMVLDTCLKRWGRSDRNPGI